ncbi:hypothetical protein OPT61_g3877 [Boeremia exigua]|uniref:Uncharacterized protein n=1 Tax=Boeremia exigua TaxID=749465 RepID=A0ACC2IGF8_9PLEO|nr:hypothetical protein OPT61_g3877 [Boeremia exigua]
MSLDLIYTTCSWLIMPAQAWLGFYPCTPTPTPTQDARLILHIDKIKETIATVRHTIDIRRQLVALSESNGFYCTTCSDRPNDPYCSTTCPLLRGSRGWCRYDETWVSLATKDVQLFEKLEADVCARAAEANKQTVWDWQAQAVVLLQRTEDTPSPRCRRPARTKIRGFNPDWSFEGHLSNGPGLEEGLAPDEVETY